jgi:hypothetical protein
MKLRSLIAATSIVVLASCSSTYRATDQTVVVAPDGVRTTFVTAYPRATNVVWYNYDQTQTFVPIDWELVGWSPMEVEDYVVSFDMDGERYYAWYDSDGTWIGSAYVITDYKDLPEAVSSTLNKQFAGYTISSVNREFHGDRMAYEIELKNSNTKTKLLIDGSGTVIKQKSKAL